MTRFSPFPVSLRQLQYVAAIAETKSFRRAAERCHVSQPSLSAQVAELEDALGVRLFERDQRRVLLTAAGQALVERARKVLVEAEVLVEAAKRFVDPLAGTLRVGVIPTIGPYLLPEVVPVLRKAFPHLVLVWVEEKTETLVLKINKGELDASLVALEANLGDLEHEAIVNDPFVLATPAGHPLGRPRSPVKPDELQGEHVLLLDDGHCLREQALSYCSNTQVEELGFRATSLPTLAQMVAGGAGITLLPQLAVPTESRRADLSLRPFASPVPTRTVVLAWRRHSPLVEALHQIAKTLRTATGARDSKPAS